MKSDFDKEAMDEYIDKASVYKKIAELEELARKSYLDTPCDSPCYQRYLAQMQERTALKHLIADTTAVDAVPVVRCRDCKYSYDDLGGLTCSHGVCVDCIVPPGFYCSFGERKESEK